jgi:hypothetical protein
MGRQIEGGSSCLWLLAQERLRFGRTDFHNDIAIGAEPYDAAE